MVDGRTARRGTLVLAAAAALTACGLSSWMPDLLSPPPPHPAAAPPAEGGEAHEIWRAAVESKAPRIGISLADRRLWLLEGNDTLLSAQVAVGRNETLTSQGKTFRFHTPRGQRKVLAKERDPHWVPPDWHYLEKAAYRKLEVVHVKRGEKYDLGDETHIEIRGEDVGRVNRFGNFHPFTPGTEIIFYGKIYVPPLDTNQRRIPDALGPYKLDMGNGYLIHGTHRYNQNSIGRAASHGCIRMRNDDLERLYERVKVGTPVYIY